MGQSQVGSISVEKRVLLFSGAQVPYGQEWGLRAMSADTGYPGFRALSAQDSACWSLSMSCLKHSHEKRSWDREECASFQDKSHSVVGHFPEL